MKKGLLLIQLGTPEASTPSSVRQYLRLFLSDKRVITLPAPLRYLLLYCIILPTRSKRSAKAYQAIWTDKGSPLRVLTHKLSNQLQNKLSTTHHVATGMRYGEPSLEKALDSLAHCDEITILPLYPQYASSTTGSSIEAVFKYFKNKPIFPTLHIIRDFYAHPAFVKAQSMQIMPYIKKSFDHCLFSYHGLPVQHIKATGCNAVCDNACPEPSNTNSACYRAQCFETSRLLANYLDLKPNQYTTAFQSRLGKTPWIEPYTDKILEQLAKAGVKDLLIACPSFVTDCLETLEEIGIEAEKNWQTLGGKTLTLIPCLNDEPHWVDALVEITHP
ncbi:MAG: ferrochelatase [Gammaproteobacteria bacterium]|nr:ferrochelatase [Gammaproteobacteria bacterium]MCH9763544.1 ferrochelatase [Gammaproteobacteria bacterium]